VGCGADHPLDAFSPGQQARAKSRCRVCVSARNRKYRAEHSEVLTAKKAIHYQANKDRILAANEARRAARGHLYEPARLAWAEANRDKQLAYFKERGQQYRAWIDSLKAGQPCLDCGDSFPPFVMEYDHVQGDKRFGIGKMMNHKSERVLAEMAKCDLVCCACHRVRSHARRKTPTTPRLVAFHQWMHTLKAAPCMDCGDTKAPEAMDFDHVTGVKTSGVADMWSWSRPKVVAELAKCELVCANCHRMRTVQSLRSDLEEAA